MKIEFDKALLWLLPYLYLVSIMYYWGYWGTLNIDAFSYYEISDLVKNIIAPVGSALASTVVVLCVVILTDFLEKRIKSESAWVNLFKIIFIVLIIFYLINNDYFDTHQESTDVRDNKHKLLIFKILLTIVLPNIIAISASIAAKKSGKYYNALTYCLIVFISTIPGRAFTTGKTNAFRISQNKEFDYIITDSLSHERSIYKYLGKAGGYYVSQTYDNTRHIITTVDKLTPLVIENFSLDDSASIRRFKIHQRELIFHTPSLSQLK